MFCSRSELLDHVELELLLEVTPELEDPEPDWPCQAPPGAEPGLSVGVAG